MLHAVSSNRPARALGPPALPLGRQGANLHCLDMMRLRCDSLHVSLAYSRVVLVVAARLVWRFHGCVKGAVGRSVSRSDTGNGVCGFCSWHEYCLPSNRVVAAALRLCSFAQAAPARRRVRGPTVSRELVMKAVLRVMALGCAFCRIASVHVLAEGQCIKLNMPTLSLRSILKMISLNAARAFQR